MDTRETTFPGACCSLVSGASVQYSAPHGPRTDVSQDRRTDLGQGLSQVIMALRWTIDIATKLEQTDAYCDETGLEQTGDYSE